MGRLAIVASGLFLLSVNNVYGMTLVSQCKVGRNTHSVRLFSSHPIYDTAIYHLRKDNSASEFIYHGLKDSSRGANVRFECAGTPERVFVISGEFTSNYIQSVVIRFNESNARWERMDFAERARPSEVYVSNNGMFVVIPNAGHETDKKYIIYRYVSGRGQEYIPAYSDSLPKSGRGQVISLRKR